MTAPAGKSLKRGASTGRMNQVRVRPFGVTWVKVPGAWDPSKEKLTVSWRIRDPNRRIRAARILYVTRAIDGKPVILAREPLTASELRHGPHRLPASRCWDGTIAEGIAGRKGGKVTADLSRIHVVVQAWNRDASSPGEIAGGEFGGRTSVAGERVAHAASETTIEAIAKGVWSREWVAPFPPRTETEANADRAAMEIRVKNVAEGTPARVAVLRVNEIPDPAKDFPYWPPEKGTSPQPGLADLVVKKSRVVRPDGSDPFVVFDRAEEHWKHPGNNFYAFRVGFGKGGDLAVASERDFRRREKKCLHMRFTVFIHMAATEMRGLAGVAQRIHDFFRKKTRWHRPYLLIGGPRNSADWQRFYENRYIVLFIGHSWPWCFHYYHPLNPKTKKFLYVPSHDFVPDQDRCPPDHKLDRSVYGGCGFRDGLFLQVYLGKVKNDAEAGPFRDVHMRLDQDPENPVQMWLHASPSLNVTTHTESYGCDTGGPRFLMWSSGCCSMITTNLGDHYVRNWTRFFAGWVWKSRADWACLFPLRVFKKWIRPGRNEWDPKRFLAVYRREARRGRWKERHPRIMDSSGVLNVWHPPGEKSRALDGILPVPPGPEPPPPTHLVKPRKGSAGGGT